MNRYEAFDATHEQADAEKDDLGRDRAIKFYELFWYRARRLTDEQVVRVLSDICDATWHGVWPKYDEDESDVEAVFDFYIDQATRDWRRIGAARARKEVAANGRRRRASKSQVGHAREHTRAEETKSLPAEETRATGPGSLRSPGPVAYHDEPLPDDA